MILLVQIICLCYTLYVLQEYATSGAYSRQHRLLPLLVGLIGVYNFLSGCPYAHRTDRTVRAFEGHALNSGALSDSYLYHIF